MAYQVPVQLIDDSRNFRQAQQQTINQFAQLNKLYEDTLRKQQASGAQQNTLTSTMRRLYSEQVKQLKATGQISKETAAAARSWLVYRQALGGTAEEAAVATRALAQLENQVAASAAAANAARSVGGGTRGRQASNAPVFIDRNTERSIKNADRAAKGLIGTLNDVSFKFFVLTFGTKLVFDNLLRGFVQVGEEVLQFERRVQALTGTTAAIQPLYDLTKELGIELETTASAFTRFALANKTLQLTQDQLVSLTRTVITFGLAGGGSTQEVAAGLQQLGQGLASSRLAGDELRSVLENLPLLASELAKQLGTTTGGLRAMGSAGLLTGDVVAGALLRAEEAARELEKALLNTTERALNRLSTAWSLFIRNTLVATGGQSGFAGAIDGLAVAFESFAELIERNAATVNLALGAITEASKALLALWAGGVVLRAIANLKNLAGAFTLLGTGLSILRAGNLAAGFGVLFGALGTVGVTAVLALTAAMYGLYKAMQENDAQIIKQTGSFDDYVKKIKEATREQREFTKIQLQNNLEAARQNLANTQAQIEAQRAALEYTPSQRGQEQRLGAIAEAQSRAADYERQIRDLEQQLNTVTAVIEGNEDALRKQAEGFKDAGKEAEEAARLVKQYASVAGSLDPNIAARNQFDEAKAVLNAQAEEIRRQIAILEEAADPLRGATLGGGPLSAATKNAAIEALKNQLEDVGRLLELNKKRFEEQISPKALDTIKQLIRAEEGFIQTPKYDVNALRLGYGTDTITNIGGNFRNVRAGDQVTRADAERDLDRRLRTEFIPAVVNAVGETAWNTLTQVQQAVLTSLSYNYGAGAFKSNSRLAAIAKSVREGAFAEAANQISNLTSNPKRRQREANLFAGLESEIVNFGEKARKEAESIAASVIPPLEKYNQELQRIQFAQEQGGLSARDAAAAQEKAAQTLGEELRAQAEVSAAYVEHQSRIKAVAEENKKRSDAAQFISDLIVEGLTKEQQAAIETARTIAELDAALQTIDLPPAIREILRLQALEGVKDKAKEASDAMYDFGDAAKDAGNSVGQAFEDAIIEGEKLRNVLAGVLKDISRAILRAGVVNPISNLFGGIFDSLFGPLSGAAHGMAPMGGLRPGIYSSPTLFAMAGGGVHQFATGGVGMLGEKYQPEAVLPLARTSDGNLGVQATGEMKVVINNNVAGAEVRTRRQGDTLTIDMVDSHVSASLAKGGSPISRALEGAYPNVRRSG